MLAVLKSGAAYLPLDPAYPARRLLLMLTDASVTTVVTDAARLPLLPGGAWEPLLFEDEELSSGAAEEEENLPFEGAPHDPAYVIYTSGSTGTPKGVVVPHYAVNRLVLGSDYIRLGKETVMAHASNISVGAATFEIWGALLNGAALVILPDEDLLDARKLSRFLEEKSISILWQTAPLFNGHVAQEPGTYRSLDCLLVGGDVVSVPAMESIKGTENAPRRIINGYGPTEVTTFAATCEIHNLSGKWESLPIGRPVANTLAYILDPEHRPVPSGTAGELYLGGPGLARGYLNLKELTEERFVTLSLPGQGTRRLYRTGDWVRRLTDGQIAFLGRMDFQVKIRGYRVEPGEVTAAVDAHPKVAMSLVTVHGKEGEKALAVYYVPLGNLDPETLRRDLSARLPGSPVTWCPPFSSP